MNKTVDEAKNLCTPLKVFVIWAPEYVEGQKYANEIYSVFSCAQDEFTANNIGVPIYFHTNPQFENFSKRISNSEKIAVVLLIDANMVISEEWAKFALAVLNFCKDKKETIVIPVSITSANTANNLCPIGVPNCIRLADDLFSSPVEFSVKVEHLCFELAHEFCRFLFNRERVGEANNSKISPSVNVFLSHARKDGATIVNTLNTFILPQSSLKTFLDVNDVPRGSDIEDKIKESIESSVFLALYTDDFSSREWCQKEILWAKKAECPIILLEALEESENRRFPYGANMKTFHLGHDKTPDNERLITKERCKKIVFEILLETLKSKYHQLFLEYTAKLYLTTKVLKKTKIFNHTPELYTVLTNLGKNTKIAIYPDPPLNIHEHEILNTCRPKCHFITPTLLPCISDTPDNVVQRFLTDRNIGISVSETGDRDQSDLHLSTFYLELCRYLLASDANILYSGDIAYKGTNFVSILEGLVTNYCFNYQKKQRIILHHLPNTAATVDYKAERKHWLKLIEIKEENTLPASLTKMRKEAAKDTFARILVGGKTQGYKGNYPGIIEEAYIALQNNTPLFIIGTYGGAATLLVEMLYGKDTQYKIDPDIQKFFQKTGFKNLNNGLTKEENEELFNCEDIARSIALILKGLKTLSMKVHKSA